MRGIKAKMLRRIARERTEGKSLAQYFVRNASKPCYSEDPATGHRKYIEPPGTFMLRDDCTRSVNKQMKELYKAEQRTC